MLRGLSCKQCVCSILDRIVPRNYLCGFDQTGAAGIVEKKLFLWCEELKNDTETFKHAVLC